VAFLMIIRKDGARQSLPRCQGPVKPNKLSSLKRHAKNQKAAAALKVFASRCARRMSIH